MADNRINGSIGLDISDFKANISELSRQIKVAETGFQAAGDGMADWGKSEEGLNARIKSLNEITELQKKKVEALTASYKKVAAEQGENSKAAQDLQIKINKETASLNSQTAELKTTKTELKNYGETSKSTSKDTDKMGNALDAIVKGAKFVAIAKVAKAATKELIDMGKAAIALTNDAAASADEISTLSLQTGLTTDKIQELSYAAELVDTSVETITSSMAKNIKSMGDARDGTEETALAYEKLGVAYKDKVTGELLNGEDVYWNVINALGAMTNATERDELSMKLLGKSAQDLNPLISAGSEKMAELAKAAHDTGYVMSGDTLNSLNSYADSLSTFDNISTSAKNALGMVLLPVLEKLSNEGGDLLGNFANAVTNANGDIGLIGGAVGDMLGTAVDTIVDMLPEIVDVGMDIVESLGGAIIKNLPKISQAAIQIIGSLATMIISNLPKLVTAAISLILYLVKAIAGNINLIVGAGIDIILGLVQGILDSLPILIAALPSIIQALVTGLIGAASQLVEAAIQIILMLVEYITNPANIELMTTLGFDLLLAIIAGLISAIPTLIESAGTIISSIWEAFKNIDWANLGLNIIMGIVEGVKSAAVNLATSVVDAAKEALEKVKEVLGIHSPATAYMPVGYNSIMGEVVGANKAKPQLIAAMRSINEEALNNSAISGTNTSAIYNVPQNGTQAGAVSNITLNQYNTSPKAIDAYETYRYEQKAARQLQLQLGGI